MIALIASVLITGCGGISKTANQMDNLPALPDVLQLGHNVLSQDTVPAFTFPIITEDQRMKVRLKSFTDLPDSTKFIGVREIGERLTLEAYLVPLSENPNDFEVYLMTRGSDGWGIHCIDLGRFHTSEHQGPMRFGANRYYTHDSSLTFDGMTHIVWHHTMTLTGIYLKDHRLTELWRVEWDDHLEIDDKGYISRTSQQETYRTEGVDDPVIEEYKSRNWAE